jgi:hypothetical protein
MRHPNGQHWDQARSGYIGQRKLARAADVGFEVSFDFLDHQLRVQTSDDALILGSDLSGVVEDVGAGVAGFHLGDEVFGVTNFRFTNAYAEYAVAVAAMIARLGWRKQSGEGENGVYFLTSYTR